MGDPVHDCWHETSYAPGGPFSYNLVGAMLRVRVDVTRADG